MSFYFIPFGVYYCQLDPQLSPVKIHGEGWPKLKFKSVNLFGSMASVSIKCFLGFRKLIPVAQILSFLLLFPRIPFCICF